MDLLILLVERHGARVSRDDIAAAALETRRRCSIPGAASTAIRKVRQALGAAAGRPRFVETVVREGYRFIAQVSVL